MDAYILDAVRTPRGRGKSNGTLYEVKPLDLLVTVLQALEKRHSLDSAQVEDVVMGCVTPVGEQGANIAKIAALHAGWNTDVAGVTLNRFCASGLEACHIAAIKVQAGVEALVVGGGVESMSRVPMTSDGGAWFTDPLVNHQHSFVPQGISADLIATLEGFDRTTVDAFAVTSHQKAAHAQTAGFFTNSVIPVKDFNGIVVLAQDEMIRPQTSSDGLRALKASFETIGAAGFDATAMRRYPHVEWIEHVHHAGNSSGIADGAAAVLIGSLEKAKSLGIRPRAKFRAMAVVGSEPTIMLTGTIPATQKALKQAGLTIDDIDLFEVNEAFAAVPLKFLKDFKMDPNKLNVNGGAIALGHPLGATGAMLLGTLLDELERRDLTFGLCTLCVGAGMGIATIIERV